jgi:ParB family chromosome partitioning protein
LITDLVPLDQIETYKLIRDRGPQEDFELAELIDSIRDIGLSNPIRVELRADGRYELIQGFRRLSAYRALLSQTGNQDVYGSIPAGIVAQGKDLESLYRQMVDENLVRKDISFAEMAQLAVTYAMDPETEEHDADKAVAVLFQSAGYQKRSYIRSFIKLVQSLGEDLMYASEIPRSLGLQLVARLEEVPGVAAAIREELKDWPQRSIKDELGVLRNYVGAGDAATSRPKNLPRGEGPAPSKAKTTFQIDRAHGRAKCVAAQGKLEIKLNRDFTAIDPRRLEAAVRSLLDQLD